LQHNYLSRIRAGKIDLTIIELMEAIVKEDEEELGIVI
jgi:hypothetical protein